MAMPGLGLQISNSPGTVVTLAGKTVRHGVAQILEECVCHVYYVRETLYCNYYVHIPPWMDQAVYLPWVGPHRGALALLLPPYIV